MRILLKLVKWLVVTVLALVIVAFFLPATQHVERSRDIKAPAEKIWPLLNDPKAWNQWSPWYAKDPAMKIEYSGPASGAGARWKWQSQSQGAGEMTFVKADDNKRLDYGLHFVDMNSTATGAFTLVPVAGGTKVTWSLDSNSGINPMARWFGLMLDRMVGPDFEAGLAGLAKAVGG